MKAVILAAGVGSRLKPLTEIIPKALIKMGEKTLIEYSLDNIKKSGITETVIVTGHLENLIKEKIGNSYQGIDISYVFNKDYAKTGSMHSLFRAKDLINDDIILLESDLLYELKALQKLLDSPEPDIILTAPLRGWGDPVFILANRSGSLVNLGKIVENQERALGELVGIGKLSLPFFKKLFNITQGDYEKAILKTSKMYPIKCLVANDLIWTEIDTEDDLRRAKEVILPKI